MTNGRLIRILAKLMQPLDYILVILKRNFFLALKLNIIITVSPGATSYVQSQKSSVYCYKESRERLYRDCIR